MSECQNCKVRLTEPSDPIEMRPDPEKGTFWPDCIGCGGGIMGLYVSKRVKEAFDVALVTYGKTFQAIVERPYPKRLKEPEAPLYFYVTGEFGAKLDFQGSGYGIKSICPTCGHVKTDPASTPSKYQLIEGSWNGADIFYTDLSRTTIFCSERILELARSHRWTNFRFVPIEEGHNYAHRGVDYLS